MMKGRNSKDYNFSVKTQYYPDSTEYVVVFDDFPNIIGAGETIEEAIKEAQDNLDAYIDYCIANKIDYPKPSTYELESSFYSGKITVRMSKSLHQQAALFAEKEGVSLNAFINDAIASHLYELKMNPIKDLVLEINANMFKKATSVNFIMDSSINNSFNKKFNWSELKEYIYNPIDNMIGKEDAVTDIAAA